MRTRLRSNWVSYFIAVGLLPVFWYFRAFYAEGDGDQIARFIEAGIWFIKTEVLSQAILQFAYKICSLWNWDGMLTLNLVSSIAGVVMVFFLIRAGEEMGENRYTFLVTLSSGFIVLACGHTEYYPQLLAGMAAWNWASMRYLRGYGSSLLSSLLFSLCVWFHQEAIFAFPAHCFLLILRKEKNHWIPWAFGLLPLVLLAIIRLVPQISPLRLEGMSHGWNVVPLWSTEGTEKLYSMFEWAHVRDILYAWGRRSIVAWPMIVASIVMQRFSAVPGQVNETGQIRWFLAVQCAGFWLLCILWHPNLGIEADWDLFAVEAIPSTLLALTFIPVIVSKRVTYYCLIILLSFSALDTWTRIYDRAQPGARDRGSVVIEVGGSEDLLIVLDGHQKGKVIPSVPEGRHYLKMIDPIERWSVDYVLVVSGGRETRVIVSKSRDLQYKPVPHR
ncbi:MAG TPA: hypothetical protein PLQ35_06100 [bacterium]|nr:hypothetical protein [bacterium]HQL61850.1 hypothetical protein [bacterium]